MNFFTIFNLRGSPDPLAAMYRLLVDHNLGEDNNDVCPSFQLESTNSIREVCTWPVGGFDVKDDVLAIFGKLNLASIYRSLDNFSSESFKVYNSILEKMLFYIYAPQLRDQWLNKK